MFLLGLLLAGCAAAFAALLIAYNTSGGPEYTVSIFGTDMVTLNSLAIFCAGLALGLIFSIGLFMMGSGTRMGRARRRRRHRYAIPPATLERNTAPAREDAAPAREARADRPRHEPIPADESGTTWSADPAAQPRTGSESGGAHRTFPNDR